MWDVDEGRLYWVDGTGRRVGKPELWRMDPRTGKVENWTLGEHDVGAMALRAGGGAVMALDDGFYFFDYDKAEMELITKVDAEQPRTRLNDGKCDRRGRFFAGGMDDKEELTICGLWRLDPDLSVTKVDGGIICTNGPCWSPDDKTFYLADSFQEEFWAYDYDIETGTLSNKRVFASTRDDAGVADGSTVDEEGCLWNAQVIGGELVRYAPDGSVERRIGMPVKNVTSVMFGRRQPRRALRHLHGPRATPGRARHVPGGGQAAVPRRRPVRCDRPRHQGYPRAPLRGVNDPAMHIPEGNFRPIERFRRRGCRDGFAERSLTDAQEALRPRRLVEPHYRRQRASRARHRRSTGQ